MLLAADNLHIINPVISHAVENRNPEPIEALVKKCQSHGADIIDINTGPLGKNAEEKMVFIVNAVKRATDLKLMIDTTNPVAMEAGLSAAGPGAIINGFSLEPDKISKILPLAARFNTSIVGYLLDQNSRVPRTSDERLFIATELFEHAKKAGVPPENIIIDPVVVPLKWENGKAHVKEVLETIRLLPDVTGLPARTIAGISNLTTGSSGNEMQKKRKNMLERTYTAMLASAGLSIALIDIFHKETVTTAHACRLLNTDMVFSWEEVET